MTVIRAPRTSALISTFSRHCFQCRRDWGLVDFQAERLFPYFKFLTIVAFLLLAILPRTQLVSLLDRTAGWRSRVGFGLEIAAALAIVTLGAWPLLR